MDDDRVVFSPVKLHREWFLAEYAPPSAGAPFATLSLTILEDRDNASVALAMEAEVVHWLSRYPVAIMVSAFDEAGDLLRIAPVRACDHLLAWPAAESGRPVLEWRLVSVSELPPQDLSTAALQTIYHDVSFRTGAELAAGVGAHRWTARIGTGFVLLGFVVVPLAWLLIEFNAPRWLSWAVLFYGLSHLYVKALKLLGYWPKSAADTAKAAEETAMRHHHYHCKLNPEGFMRLKAENFDREAREKTRKEADLLRPKDTERAG